MKYSYKNSEIELGIVKRNENKNNIGKKWKRKRILL